MSDGENIRAWLEQSSGARVPIAGTCSIGRLSSNTIMLPEERVSRRHALINVQGDHEFWLVDLGSGNGTYLNGRRVGQPTRLHHGDQIEIGSFQLRFHQNTANRPAQQPTASESTITEKTLQHIKPMDCWLLVADIEDSTQLIQTVSESELPLVTGRWLEDCRGLVEACGGSINKFLGDGFFAYWPAGKDSDQQVAKAIQSLTRMQDKVNLAFRFVVHHGQIFTGGAASLGEESLQGKEVHFIFRMEKLAGSIGERCLASAAARARLPVNLSWTEAGLHPLAGFDGEYPFYALAAEAAEAPAPP